MKAVTVHLEHTRVARVGTYLASDGEGEPELRVFISAGWRSVPLLPFARETVDIPSEALPALLEALRGLDGEP